MNLYQLPPPEAEKPEGLSITFAIDAPEAIGSRFKRLTTIVALFWHSRRHEDLRQMAFENFDLLPDTSWQAIIWYIFSPESDVLETYINKLNGRSGRLHGKIRSFK